MASSSSLPPPRSSLSPRTASVWKELTARLDKEFNLTHFGHYIADERDRVAVIGERNY